MAERIAIVTGAGRRAGIGWALCRALAAAGHPVFFTYWSAYDRTFYDEPGESPTALLDSLRAAGVSAAALELDLGAEGAPERLIEAVTTQLGPPAILVNNAAYSTRADYRQLDGAALDAHYRINVRGTALLSVAFARTFVGQHGRIITLTSGQGRGPMPGELAYVASKGAIEAFMLTLAAEVAERGITVNAVDPGPTDTGWIDDDLRARLLPLFPRGRIGQPDDAAHLVTFLASEAADWITGQVIRSHGGFPVTL